jgi:hypothetical protein
MQYGELKTECNANSGWNKEKKAEEEEKLQIASPLQSVKIMRTKRGRNL